MPRPRRSSRRNYNRIVGGSDGQDDPSSSGVVSAHDEPPPPSSSLADDGGGENNNADDDDDDDDGVRSNNDVVVGGGVRSSSSSSSSSLLLLPPSPAAVLPEVVVENGINVVLMDAAQTKFDVICDPRWKVSEFKEVSARVTKVPPRSQRLIHMGRLLEDGMTLDECGIREDGRIVHLFPKPNVVIGGSNGRGGGGGGTTTANDAGRAADDDGDGTTGTSAGGGGAHVPQIILDAEEASRRSQILILSSQEIFEAQHRVKIFSFLLMIISSMELLTLMTLFVGVQVGEDPNAYGGGGGGSSSHELPPGNPTDSPPANPNASDMDMEMRTWQDSDYFDAIISAFGFYVSLLGIKATSENTSQLARRYLLCLTAAGVGSNCYYYYLNVNAQRRQAEAHNQIVGGSALYATAFVGILLPLTVWTMCIGRAYQFQSLIREAEVEAEERTRGSNGGGGGGGGAGMGENSRVEVVGETSRTLSYGSEDLELAVERGVST